MSKIAGNQLRGLFAFEDGRAMERRLFAGMCAVVSLAVLFSAPLAPWRITSGLALGGGLSLLNHYWLRSSVAAALDGRVPAIKASRFLLRYLVAGTVIAAASFFDLVSLTAALAGMCSFVAAALAEAFIQTCLSIVRREG